MFQLFATIDGFRNPENLTSWYGKNIILQRKEQGFIHSNGGCETNWDATNNVTPT